jgi:hypothetical protein
VKTVHGGGAAAAAGVFKKRRRQADSDDEQGVATATAAADEEDESVKVHLRRVVSTSFSMLRRALFEHNGLTPLPFFTFSWYASLVGALRLNALAVEHPSPLRDYIAVVNYTLKNLCKQLSDAANHDKDDHPYTSSSDDSDEDSSDDEEEEDVPSKKKKINAALSVVQKLGARAEHDTILGQLLPILTRVMHVRQSDRMERRRARAGARLARLQGRAEVGSSSSEHNRQRTLPRDSHESEHFHWTLRASRAQQASLRFSTRLLSSYHGSALYPTIACANHSCVPNASVEHEGPDAAATLLATRDIAEGEQIYISYINEDQSKAARREELRDHAFVCQCERCAQEPSDDSDDDGNNDDEDDEEEED